MGNTDVLFHANSILTAAQFNIETVDTDAFREELKFWKTIDVSASSFTKTPPLVIDVVLLTRDLTSNQTLVLLGDFGQRWDVESGGARRRLASTEIVLERWTVEWEPFTAQDIPELPVTYKKSIVVFRSLFTLTRLLPAWKLRKKLAKSKLTGSALKVVCCIGNEAQSSDQEARVPLSQPIVHGRESKVERHDFHSIETPAGKLRTSVEYRTECDFRIDDSEALLSSQFLTSDEGGLSRPPSSLPLETATRRTPRSGSSLTTFQQAMHSSGSNHSLPYMGAGEGRTSSNSSLTRPDRRPSAALIQPFKTPSLSISPSIDPMSGSPRHLPRTQSSVSIDRINARGSGYQQPQRIPSSLNDSTGFSLSGSPRKPGQPPQLIKRYSSSFGQRSGSFSSRRRTSQASDSVIQHGSSGSRASSRSPSTLLQSNEDEDELGDFVKMLDTRRPLTGSQFRDDTTKESSILSESMIHRTRSELSRFQRLKETHASITDSLINTTLLRNDMSTEISRPPRRSSSIPTLSDEGQPSPLGKSIPSHIPAIPSRLSESSIMPRASVAHARGESASGLPLRESLSPEQNIGAVNIPLPLSPHLQPRQRSTSCRSQSANSTHEFDQSTKISTSLDSMASLSHKSNLATPIKQREIDRASIAGAHTSSSTHSHASFGVSSTRGRFAARGRSYSSSSQQMDNSLPFSTKERRTELSQGETNRSGATAAEDDDLFFAMSDIHLKSS